MVQSTLDEILDIEGSTEVLVSFRDLVPEIPSTTYASHGMYYHPARFIPQVVRWAILKYTKQGDWVIDPFAGSGTVCVESLMTNRNSVSLDLNPMLEYLLKAKTYRQADWDEIESIAHNLLSNETPYKPKWSRIHYWHPDELFSPLSVMWGAYHENAHPLILIALLKTTKKYSYADDQVPKLFKSKRKTREIRQILEGSYHRQMRDYFLQTLRRTYRSSVEFGKCYRGGKSVAKGGIDLMDYELDGQYQLLITSPPYGIAHEYIRSFKLELAWLGYEDEEITSLINHEIPYNRSTPKIDIASGTYRDFVKKIHPRVIRYCQTYFKSVLYCLEKVMERLNSNGYAAIFVGNATFSGVRMPFHKIFREHFEERGYLFNGLLKDKIKARRLFRGRNNLSPDGIAFEYLLVMRKS